MCSSFTMCRVFSLLLVFIIDVYNADEDFGYYGMKGPEYWVDRLHYNSCVGKLQSPIDIQEHLLTPVRFPLLTFKGFNLLPKSGLLTNNGHTVMLELYTGEPAIVSGGPLPGEYVFSQLHFHWGSNDSVGSENRINNRSFSMELHMVFFKKEYGDKLTAMRHKDGLTVFAVFYEASDFENRVYSQIVKHLNKVVQPHTKVEFYSLITLDSLLPSNKYHYFTYNGSLTTPPCYEIVIWLDFKEPIFLSRSQIATFRTLRSPDGVLVENFRPIQPLEGRTVYYNIGERPFFSDQVHRGTGSSTKATFHIFFFILLTTILS